MRSLDIVLNLLVNWFNKSSTTCTRSAGCVSGAGYRKRQSTHTSDVWLMFLRRTSYTRRARDGESVDLS
jgi:hypothetical protein